MLLQWRETLRPDRCEAGICGALVIGQALFLAYLLRLSVIESMLFALLVGLPVALACYGLLARSNDRCRMDLLVVMFATGGFGMLLGCVADFGPLRLYGLLGICRSLSNDVYWPGPTQLWLMIRLMPWACVGMLAGGILGMAAFDALRHRQAKPAARRIGQYVVCNVGMLLGMVICEHVVTRITTGLSQGVAGALTVAGMLVGMTLGMSAMLALAARASMVGRVVGRMAPPRT